MNLETLAIGFLRFEKRCPLVLCERTHCMTVGRPDVYGLTKSRHTFEIEIKRSMADLRANGLKRHVEYRDIWIKKWPRKFWFLVPNDIHKKAELEIPQWAGLLTEHEGRIVTIKHAPVNSLSERLPIKQALKWVHLQSNQLYAVHRDFSYLQEHVRNLSNPIKLA